MAIRDFYLRLTAEEIGELPAAETEVSVAYVNPYNSVEFVPELRRSSANVVPRRPLPYI